MKRVLQVLFIIVLAAFLFFLIYLVINKQNAENIESINTEDVNKEIVVENKVEDTIIDDVEELAKEIIITKTEDMSEELDVVDELNRSTANVTIKVKEESVSKGGVELFITDNNETTFGIDDSNRYVIEKMLDGNWEALEPDTPVGILAIARPKNEEKEFDLEIKWINYYGQLEDGTYRIGITVHVNKEPHVIYSDEFIIDPNTPVEIEEEYETEYEIKDYNEDGSIKTVTNTLKED